MAEVIIDYDKIDSAVSSMNEEINKLKELFEKQDKNFNKLEDKEKWYGMTSQNCVAKYRELSSKYEGVINELNKYPKFLLDVEKSYKELDNEAINKMDSYNL